MIILDLEQFHTRFQIGGALFAIGALLWLYWISRAARLEKKSKK